ncbi:MAG: hypothetical protein RLZZ387_802 [Chloroflexota bacterium]|jgi:hypothetical protein
MGRRAVIAGLALLAALVAVSPTLLWAYHLSRAGALLERGLVWPEPRMVDSLPIMADTGALEEAVRELEAARSWRPGLAYAYRLAGYVALARGDWAGAARELEAARTRAQRHPLIAWETGLAYEQLWQATPSDLAARERMAEAWRAGGFDAASLRLRAEEARIAGRAEEAQRWERRAALMEP